MPVLAATHNGPFHADDVLAFGLIRVFWDADATIVRTRDKDQLDAADIVFDVGGLFDSEAKRFDHHQASYTGPLSSAGMVLAWLEETGKMPAAVASTLRTGWVEYVDDVDNGRVAPKADLPCFPRIIEALNGPCHTLDEFDRAYVRAADIAVAIVEGVVAEVERTLQAKALVAKAMDDAVQAGRAVIFFDEYTSWKAPYFALGGASHPTDYIVFGANDDTWRIVAIPPKLGDFGQKRPLPQAWAGLTDEALAAVVGVEDAVFCHKNRFIAVFRSRQGAVDALEKHGLMRRESP